MPNAAPPPTGATASKGGSAAPAEAKKTTTWKEQAIVYGLLCLLLLPSLFCYHVYGYHFFVPDVFTRLKHTPAEWQTMLRNRTVVMIGGPHRGGTSVLWEVLSMHPEISAFGSTRETGADHSEGIFVQSVYPRFGIGHEFTRGKEGGKGKNAWRPTGMGRYALGAEPDVHMTETHRLVTPEKQAQLLNEYGRFWDLTDKPVLVEKSPPNAVISRFLQALLNLGNPTGWEPSAPTFGGGQSVAKFIFISRHPLANAYAHRAQGACRDERLAVLVANWLAVHEYLEQDITHLQHAKRLRLEDLAASPEAAEATIAGLWEWLGLSAQPALAKQAAAKIRQAPNAKYIEQHCATMAAEPRARAAFERAAEELNGRVQAIAVTGDLASRYNMLDDEWRCAALPPLDEALAEDAARQEAKAALKDEN